MKNEKYLGQKAVAILNSPVGNRIAAATRRNNNDKEE